MSELNSRQKQLRALQAAFPTFVPFLIVGMRFLGFNASEIQKNIGEYLQYGPANLMVQAQRSQAKTTITALFAVWSLIHNPKCRVLVVSAGNSTANEISTLITRLILTMPILECMRPDKTAGDRTSVEAFDLHYSLKGVDKSPSVACIGVTGTLQGKRSDLLIADDIESQKNSRTPQMRELLMELTRDFSSIVQNGRIIFLGTPQSDSSVYNSLPSRGFDLRIWPGRYPTPKQLADYGAYLAPIIRERIEADPSLQYGGGVAGDEGKPVDPELLPEEALQKKWLSQGASYFQLQHMLSTKLSDELRYPLKLSQLVVMRLGERLPVHFERGVSFEHMRQYVVGDMKFHCALPGHVSDEFRLPEGRVMFVDPAGGGKNGDETAVAVVDHCAGNIFVRAVTGFPGGYSDEAMTGLAQFAARWKPSVIQVEKNLGFGSFTQVLLPYLRKAGVITKVEDIWHSGQKEERIIETLEPIMGRGSLVFDESIIADDWQSTVRYPADKRKLYCLTFQLSKVTRDRGALVKDDRLDALAGAVAYWVRTLGIDSASEAQRAKEAELLAWMKDPMAYNRYKGPLPVRSAGSTIKRRR